MNIKTGVIKATLKQKASFFYKIKIFAESEIGKRIIDEQQAKRHNRNPKQHLEEKFCRLLKGDYPGIFHTAGCDKIMMEVYGLVHKPRCYKYVKGNFKNLPL